MTVTVYDFPRDWANLIVTQTFTLRSLSETSPRPWGGGKNVAGPLVQAFVSDVTMAPQKDPVLQDMDALFTALRGQSGVLRMYNALRWAPWYDRALTPTTSTWSDSSTFTDGTGFANGYLPPDVFVAQAAARGANYLVLGGFPVSTAGVIRRGDLLQVKPNGIPGSVPHLYKALQSGSSDASGNIGLAIAPTLRAGVAIGDPVGLRYASSLFRLLDDNQADIQMTGDQVGNFGFSLVEALDLVP